MKDPLTKSVKDMIENIESCHVSDDRWCPTCEDAWSSIRDIALCYLRQQERLGSPIKKAYKNSKSIDCTDSNQVSTNERILEAERMLAKVNWETKRVIHE